MTKRHVHHLISTKLHCAPPKFIGTELHCEPWFVCTLWTTEWLHSVSMPLKVSGIQCRSMVQGEALTCWSGAQHSFHKPIHTIFGERPYWCISVESIRRIHACSAAQEGTCWMNGEGKTCAQLVELTIKVSNETKKIFQVTYNNIVIRQLEPTLQVNKYTASASIKWLPLVYS